MNSFPLTTLSTLLAIGLFIYMGLRVGLSRGKYEVPAPATTGHPIFERLFRVHMNTLEAMPAFLPLLWLFALYHGDGLAAAIGLVWFAGRIIFMQSYVADPSKRSRGFQIQFFAQVVLLIGTLIGAVGDLIS